MSASDDERGGGTPAPRRTQYGVVIPTPAAGVPRLPTPPAGVALATPPHDAATTRRPPGAPRPTRSPIATEETAFATGAPQPATQPASGGNAYGLAPGMLVHHYELIRELGRGGMGMVWAARDTRLGRRVAIKFLLQASRDVAERFLVEARATAQCSHENIVIIHEVGEIDGKPYMVLEYLEGQPLRGVMGEFGTGTQVPPSRVVELVLPITRALARAHAAGIVHRDLKPENVFVTSAGQVKVLDFGIAKALGTPDAVARRTQMVDIASLRTNQTREGALVGTLPYMSPEQLSGGDVDRRSDIWALGIMMFEMLAGRHPIEPLTPATLFETAADDAPMPSIRDLVPEVPDGLALLIDGCLRKRAVERIAQASDVVQRLEGLLPGRHGRQLAEGESPYPGLSAFQEGDADRFFGRTREIARMATRIRELPLTAVVGPSGVGKSSFIRAGVGPALKGSGERWDVVTLRPGRAPIAALASIVQTLTTRSGADMQTQVAQHREIVQRIRSEPGYVGMLLRARARHVGCKILLFVDQFEELYTLVPEPEERHAFTAALAGIADDTAAPLRVVVSMRSDFLDRVAENDRFLEELSRGLVFLTPPDRNGLREALVAPVELVGHRFENPAMVEDMLDALAGTPGALPLLQFAAARLWDNRDRQRRLLTAASYSTIGGVTGALATHADEVIAQLSAPTQRLAQRVFRALVTPERTRAIVELADLYQLTPDPTEANRIVDQLVAARLLVVQTRGDGSGGTVEIVHESLIERWPTLRRWLDEDQEDAAFAAQLAAAAKQWEARGRAPGLLWRGEAVDDARRWFTQRPRELAPRDRAFLDAALALAARGKRARRVALIGTFVALAAVATGAVVALVSIRGAERIASEQAVRAEREAANATAALEQMQQKERERLAAEQQTQRVEVEKQQAQSEVQLSREELERKNAQLELTLAEARAAKERAELERGKANAAAVELKRARDDLAAANAKQRAEIDRLNAEAAKLTKKLK